MSLAIVITATVLATGNNPPSQREGGLARLNWAGTRTGCDGDPNTHRAHGAHLVATVTAQAITGTVTLKDGRSAPFTARLLPDPGRTYGLFRSEQTFHGVRYLGGWILNPPSFASARVGAGASAGVSLTAALLPDPVGFHPLRGGIGIINEQTGALIVSPLLDNLVSVTVPGVGTFPLTHCLRARC